MLTGLKRLLFQNQSLKQTVAKNTFWLSFGEITVRLLKMAIVVYAARILGANGWGVFSYALTLISFFTIFSDFGLGSILIREISKNKENQDKILSTAFSIKLILVTVTSVLVILISPFITKIEEAKSLIPIMLLFFIFDAFKEFGFSLIRALEKMEKEAFIKIFTNTSLVALGFILLYFSPTSRSLALAYVLGSGLGLIALIFILIPHFKNLFSNFSSELLKPIISSAWPFTILTFIGTIMATTDILMIGWFKGAAEVGFYSAAQKPVGLLFMIPAILTTSLFPTISRLVKKDEDKLSQILEKSIALVLMIGIPLMVGGTILSKDIILLLFGNEYFPSISVFRILLSSILIIFPAMLISNTIFAYDKQKKVIKYAITGIILNVILNSLMIPTIGIMGAALATISSQFFIHGLMWAELKKINNFKTFIFLKNALIATFAMALVVSCLDYLNFNFFIKLAAGIIIYFISLKLLKEPFVKEINAIIRAI